jgi:glycosyltransferase involved in cell wall biosynthesis
MSTRKLKIAAFQNLPKGGARRTNNELLNKLTKHNTVDVYESEKTTFNSFFQYYIFTLFLLRPIHKKIAKTIDSKEYDLAIVNHDYLTKAPYLLRYLKTKTYYLCHEEPREFYQDKIFFNTSLKSIIINFIRLPLKIIDRANVKKAHVLIANSKYSATKLKKIYNRKFEHLNLGVDSRKFKVIKEIHKKNLFVTVGSTSKFKGIDFLIKAISKLPKKYQYPLLVIGDIGRDNTKINKLAKQLKVKIQLEKKINDKKLVYYYNTARLTLAAGRNEPFGLFLLESLSCGTRVIAINEGGYGEIINNKIYGKLVKRNVYLFKNAILDELETTIDRNMIHKNVSKIWNWDKSNNQFMKIIYKYL